MDDIGYLLGIFAIILAIFFIIGFVSMGIDLHKACTNEAVITETEIQVQITHLDQVSDNEHIKYYASITDFGDHADTMEITKEQYAKLKVGDTIDVVCTVTENTKLPDSVKYTIK